MNKVIFKKGFIALTLVLSVSSLLIAFVYTQSIEIAHFFDQTQTKEYRIMNYYYAFGCIDQAILHLHQDYFYTIDIFSPASIKELNCVIDEVYRDGDFAFIKAHGNYKGVNVGRKAKVKLYDNYLEIISIE